jgi:hypothetical protein
MYVCFHWASQTQLKNSRYTQPYGTCLCYKVCVQVQGAANCTHGVRQCYEVLCGVGVGEGARCMHNGDIMGDDVGMMDMLPTSHSVV